MLVLGCVDGVGNVLDSSGELSEMARLISSASHLRRRRMKKKKQSSLESGVNGVGLSSPGGNSCVVVQSEAEDFQDVSSFGRKPKAILGLLYKLLLVLFFK